MIEQSADLTDRLFQSHEEYARLRWSSITTEDQKVLEAASKRIESSSLSRMHDMMKHSGIAGSNVTAFLQTSNCTTLEKQKSSSHALPTSAPPIKCLHAHYAHHRSTTNTRLALPFSSFTINPVGERVHELLAQEFPYLSL
eukprot:CAMPEP_0178737940 /NCGR_PEP_ID=MMETSP0744-20121128/3242_1 /TAXON_ID=913974 /ORGANISM="Nitzschia punctata, Strain CCMP561" /LENGTH=140 /DNA_ID=CAMNT_0020390515 /DNA_START=60 /DNA_END=482 /DNA_ORIENTATION=+